MPKIIRIKRGDVANLNNHVLQDGEPAYTRNRVMEAGPQRGETVADYYFRVGDGTSAGGIVPGASSIGVGLQYAISSSSSALKMVEDLMGDYWTPWATKSFNKPYDPFNLDDTTINAITPDILNNNSNVHLGYGYLMFDGTGLDLRSTNQPFQFQVNTAIDTTEASSLASIRFFSSFNTSQNWSLGVRNLIGMRSWASLDQSSVAVEADLIAFMGHPVNQTDSTVRYGSCFVAATVTQDTVTYPIPGRMINYYGFKCATVSNPRWAAANPTNPEFIRNYYGFYIDDQSASAFYGNTYGVRIGALDSGPGVGVGSGQDDPIVYGDTTGSGVTRAFDVYMTGASASKSMAFSAWYVGTDRSDTVGSTAATGFLSQTVGNPNITTLAYGFHASRVAGNDAFGVCIDNVQSKSAVGSDTSGNIVAGVLVRNLYRISSTNLWSYGFLQRPQTELNVSKHASYSAYGVDSNGSVATSEIYAGYFRGIGMVNAYKAYGMYADYIGNVNNTIWATAFEGRNITAKSGKVRGLHIHTISNVGDSSVVVGDVTYDNAYGALVWDVTAELDVGGYNVGYMRSNHGRVRGFQCSDIYVTSTDNTSWVYAFSKDNQTTESGRILTKYATYHSGVVDCSSGNNATIYGVYLEGLGTRYASSVRGITMDNIGLTDTSVSSNATDARAINVGFVGGSSATLAYGLYIGDAANHVNTLYGIWAGSSSSSSRARGVVVNGVRSEGAYDSSTFIASATGYVATYISAKNPAQGYVAYKIRSENSAAYGYSVQYLSGGNGTSYGTDVYGFYMHTQGDYDSTGVFKQWDGDSSLGNFTLYAKSISVFAAGSVDVNASHSHSGSEVYGVKLSKIGSHRADKAVGVYIQAVGCGWSSGLVPTDSNTLPNWGDSTLSAGVLIDWVGTMTNNGVDQSVQLGCRGYAVSNVLSRTNAMGYWIGNLRATVGSRSFGFAKSGQTNIGFKYLTVFGTNIADDYAGEIDSSSFVNNSILAGIDFGVLGRNNVQTVYGAHFSGLGIGADTSAGTSYRAIWGLKFDAVGSEEVNKSIGIEITSLKYGGDTTNASYGLNIASVTGSSTNERASFRAIYVGAINSAAGAVSGLTIAGINTSTVSSRITGIDFGGITASETSTDQSIYGIRIGSVSAKVTAGETGVYGLYIDSVTNTGTAPAYSIYTGAGRVHIALPTDASGLATGDWYMDSSTRHVCIAGA